MTVLVTWGRGSAAGGAFSTPWTPRSVPVLALPRRPARLPVGLRVDTDDDCPEDDCELVVVESVCVLVRVLVGLARSASFNSFLNCFTSAVVAARPATVETHRLVIALASSMFVNWTLDELVVLFDDDVDVSVDDELVDVLLTVGTATSTPTKPWA